MEEFYLEEPSLKRKEEAIDYIRENIEYNSSINGVGGLDSYCDKYEEWLEKVNKERFQENIPDDKSPRFTYFLIRNKDDKIIGMINIRSRMTPSLFIYGGNIGYGIRPTERGKRYSKINLYLGLEKCFDLGMDSVLISANDDNPASFRTILALGGILENKKLDDNNKPYGRYWIDVERSLENYKEIYKPKKKN